MTILYERQTLFMINTLIPAGLIMGGSVVSLREILRETLLISN